MITVYALIDPRDDSYFYVGRTSNYHKRMLKHNSPQTNKGTFKNEYIKELKTAGYNFTSEILEEVTTKADGKFWEIFYTDLFRSWGFDLQNNRYYKMGNQTSFQPGINLKPIVGVSKDGTEIRYFESTKQAKAILGHGLGIGQSIMRVKKSAGGYVWFRKDDYEKISKEEFDRIMTWANTSEIGKPNSGQFKKGHRSSKKIEISDELASQIIEAFTCTKATSRKLAEQFNVSRNVVLRVTKGL